MAKGRTKKRTLLLRAPERRVRLEFLTPCGEIVSVRARNPRVRHWSTGNRLELHFPEPPGEHEEIVVEYSGEVLELDRVHAPVARLERACPPVDYWVWRDTKAQAGPYTPAKQYFNFMDFNAPMNSASVKSLATRCEERLNERRTVQQPTFKAQPSYLTKKNLKLQSSILLGGLRSFLPDGGGGFDLTQAEEAFERFGAGELSLVRDEPCFTEDQRQACQPNSAYMFLFAEFADMCIEVGIDAQDWQALLHGLVHSAGVFCDHYETAPGAPRIAMTGTATLRDPLKAARSGADIAQALTQFKNDNLLGLPLATVWQQLVQNRLEFPALIAPLTFP